MLEVDFLNRRTRLQRLSDARFFSGWLTKIQSGEITVHLVGQAPLHRDDVCMFEVYGRKATAHFRGRVHTRSGKLGVFGVEPPIRYFAAQQEDTRLNLAGISGKAKWEGIEVPVEVVDGSEGGIGLLSEVKLSRGDMVELTVETPYGTMTGRGEVRYSRVSDDDANRFRTGIKLDDMNRVERARWDRVLSDAQEPTKRKERLAG